MCMSEKQLFEQLKNSVIYMEEDRAEETAKEIVSRGLDVFAAVEALVDSMEVVGEYYDQEEYFIPDVLTCADAMNAALKVLKDHMGEAASDKKPLIIIGVIKGDTHDIGKNIVRIFLESGGFEVIDLGRDVEPSVFVETAREFDADIIAVSSLMTTTMWTMKEVIDLLTKEDVRHKFKVMVGGRPLSPKFAKQIGADGYSANAKEALGLARKLTRR